MSEQWIQGDFVDGGGSGDGSVVYIVGDVKVREENLVVRVTEAEEVVVTTETDVQLIDVGIQGVQGKQGDQGETGETGEVGPEGPSFQYRHIQAVPSDTWIVEHNLNGFPNVTVVDSANDEVIGDVRYLDANTVEITFSGGFSGEAYLS